MTSCIIAAATTGHSDYIIKNMVLFAVKVVASLLLFLQSADFTTASENGEEARWVVEKSSWGTLSWVEEEVSSMVTSTAETEGRVFVYLPFGESFKGALTFSEAALDSSQFDGARCGPDGDLDPEDPRCAKLTISGTFNPCGDDTRQLGLDTLFKKHPQMSDWPDDHGFVVHELDISDVWMIANFGGGGYIDTSDYKTSDPIHHPFKGFRSRRTDEKQVNVRPDFGDDAAGHARWLVGQSLWTTISTVSTKDEGNAFGNIRSVVDGACFLSSTGLPFFYIPSPDPTAVDIASNDFVALSFTEASLPQLVGEDGKICGGMDPEDPTCAKISLTGYARPVDDDDQIEVAKNAFAAQHPRASWLSGGGAHTGGSYYTLELEGIEFFRNYGGMADLSVDDYLEWEPDSMDFNEEQSCEGMNFLPSEDNEGHEEWGQHHDNGDSMHGEGHMEWEHGEGHGYEDHKHGEHEHEHGGQGESHEHEYGGHGEGHEHGGHGEYNEHGGDERGHYDYSSDENSSGNTSIDAKEHDNSMISFFFGLGFGFLIWGPTIALIVYYKSCRRDSRAVASASEYEPASDKEFV